LYLNISHSIKSDGIKRYIYSRRSLKRRKTRGHRLFQKEPLLLRGVGWKYRRGVCIISGEIPVLLVVLVIVAGGEPPALAYLSKNKLLPVLLYYWLPYCYPYEP
jgi:hypothetical protein